MTAIRATDVAVRLGGTAILHGIDADLAAGEVVGLIGANGAGKTTLLRALAGLLPLARGAITLDGRALAQLSRRQLAQTLAYLPQGGGSQWPVSVETLVMLGRLPHLGPWRGPGARDRRAVDAALAACDVARFRDRTLDTLSGGERARVLIARALASEPRVLLADEPVAGLDPGHQLDVMATLRRLAASGAGIVAVVHDLTLAARFCDRLVLLDAGRVAAAGQPRAVLSHENLARCYGIRAHVAEFDGTPWVVPATRIAGPEPHVRP
jgi:iron complex transport system ATP-binding protein